MREKVWERKNDKERGGERVKKECESEGKKWDNQQRVRQKKMTREKEREMITFEKERERERERNVWERK